MVVAVAGRQGVTSPRLGTPLLPVGVVNIDPPPSSPLLKSAGNTAPRPLQHPRRGVRSVDVFAERSDYAAPDKGGGMSVARRSRRPEETYTILLM